ncbi:hypothetical protein TNCV_660651 [Trichonephila clavipes]|nr:hypothetical protein TNCV_660651 [Trichonephila clavipes]
MNRIKKKGNEHMRSLLDGVETSRKEMDPARKEPDEKMDINPNNESKLEDIKQPETFETKEDFETSLKELNQKGHETTSVSQDRLPLFKKTQESKSSNVIC